MVKTAKTPMDRKKRFKQQLKIHSKYNYKSKNQSNIMTILDSAYVRQDRVYRLHLNVSVRI